MTGNKWDPFRDLVSLSELMGQSFDPSWSSSQHQMEESKGTWTPAVDILDTGNEIYICSELPGLEIKDINLEIKDRTLLMSGERSRETEVKKGRYYRLERSYGKFHRAFKLSEDVDSSAVQAKLQNGILEIHLPKKKRIPSTQGVKVKVAGADEDG